MEESKDHQILALIRDPIQIDNGFKLLLQQYQEKLYWHIRYMVTDHEDANDILQEVLIKVYRNIQGFEGKAKLYTWIYRIATNETITYLNKRKKKATVSLMQERLNLENNLKADTYFDGTNSHIKLQQALISLPEKQRLVFSMRYFEELSYQEMAAILETSTGALKASYHHAVKKIERFLKEET